MPRPRQATLNDCVVAVFREITGEAEGPARARFLDYLRITAAIPIDVLSSRLTDAGWMLTKDDYHAQQVANADNSIKEEAFEKFWKEFQGEAVVGYSVNNETTGHVVVVRTGGTLFDPSPSAPEEGEFIAHYVKRLSGNVTITSVSRVVRMILPDDK
jgi:hypothetical protein